MKLNSMNSINFIYKDTPIKLSFVEANDKDINGVFYENRQYSLVVTGIDKTDTSIIKEVEEFVISKLNGENHLSKNQFIEALIKTLNATILTEDPNVQSIKDVALSIMTLKPSVSSEAKFQSYLLSAIKNFGFQGSVFIRKGNKKIADSSSMTELSDKIYDSNSLFQIGSLTKLLMATAIMRLVDRGKIQINQSINTYLPNTYHHPDWEKITVEDLLTHRSGLPNYHHAEVSDFPRGRSLIYLI